MADSVVIEGGFNDIDLESDFLDGSINGILLTFAQSLQDDLIQSALQHDHQTAANTLIKDLQVNPNIIETDGTITYILDLPAYGSFLDQGVNGAGVPSEYKGKPGTVVTGSPYGYKTNSKPPFFGMINYAKNKDKLQGMFKKPSDAVSFGMAAARRKKYFGQKPSYWFTDVITDGRIEALEEEIGKKLAFVMIDRFTDGKIKTV